MQGRSAPLRNTLPTGREGRMIEEKDSVLVVYNSWPWRWSTYWSKRRI